MAPTCFGPFGPSSGSIRWNLAKVPVFVEIISKNTSLKLLLCSGNMCFTPHSTQYTQQPLVGFRPAQLSLNILSRKVFTECRCQRHVKPPTWRTRDLERSHFRHKRPPASEATLANPAAEGGTMGEKWPRNFAESGDFHVTFGFFYMP
jgi:hypothetical protein